MTTGVLRAAPPSRARTRAPGKRRGGLGLAIAASVLAHAAAISPLVWWRTPRPPALPPVYQVELIAAPPGPRAIGTVSPEPPAPGPEAAAPAPAPTPATPPAPAAPKPAPVPPAPAPKAAPVKTPPEAAPKPVPPKPVATPTVAKPKPATAPDAKATAKATAATKAGAKPADAKAGAGGTAPGKGPAGPRAGGGPEGGKGSDVANVSIKGLPFPFPGYLQNIVRQVALRFSPPRGGVLQADLAFLIHRDGSVSDIRVVKASGNYAFDLEAQGAVESAGSARAFGPLPQGFRDDVLPVTFSFDPRVLR